MFSFFDEPNLSDGKYAGCHVHAKYKLCPNFDYVIALIEWNRPNG